MAAKACRTAREAAQDAFDRESPPPADALAHAGRCPACAAYLRTLEAYGTEVRLPPPPRRAEAARLSLRLGSALVFGAAAAAAVLAVALIPALSRERLLKNDTRRFVAEIIDAPLLLDRNAPSENEVFDAGFFGDFPAATPSP